MPELADQAAARRLQDFVVFDCNWTALEVFLNSTTQWRFNAMGGVTSLDYSAVRAVMQMMNIRRKDQHDVFNRVRLIESSAIPALTKLRNKTSHGRKTV